jgi:pSer/pThr/pTyr-binding forkhead associated (FHA) protein
MIGWIMAVILEIKSGPFAGRKIPLRDGESVLIGRASERAQFAVPHDNKMSGVHFAVECGPAGCRVIDKKSTNGTFLNGTRIQETVLANGDEIKSGQTIFVVRIVPDGQLSASPSSSAAATPKSATPAEIASAKLPAAAVLPSPPSAPSSLPALVIGGWTFYKIPERWQVQEGQGIQQIVKDAFSASVSAMEEPMGPDVTLLKFVEAHMQMFREHLPQPKIDSIPPAPIRGSEETAALEIRFTIKDGPAVYWHRVYVRSGAVIGVLMLVALEKNVSSIRPIFNSVLSDISFSQSRQA